MRSKKSFMLSKEASIFSSFSSVHPLVRDLEKQPYRHVDGLPRRFMAPSLEYVEHDGRPAVIYSKYDLSCALLGNQNPLARGATPEAAQTILTHLLGQLTAPPKTP